MSLYKDKHNIVEHFVFLSHDDFRPTSRLGRFMAAIVIYSYDFDVIIVNQLMHTFRRQQGYMVNKETSEDWSWHKDDYTTLMTHPKFDFESNYLGFATYLFWQKFKRLIGTIISFMTLSFINGLACRIAIMTSNVVIFPLMWIIKVIMGQGMTFNQRAQVFHSMGYIGAQAAYYERHNQPKSMFLCTLCFTLFLICFMQTSCYYLWTQMMFPYTFPNTLNDMYFGYINLAEFASLLFIRTRMSIKFAPKLVTMLNLTFLFYINSYLYAASCQFFFFMFCTTVAVFAFFLLNYEYEAINTWNPFDIYTPRYLNPRAAYQLVLDDASFGTGFYFWHMFMPV